MKCPPSPETHANASGPKRFKSVTELEFSGMQDNPPQQNEKQNEAFACFKVNEKEV